MDPSQNLYAILGVPPEATHEDIREAYRLAARRFHPDANPQPGVDLHFRDIVNAHELLGDRVLRADYDLVRRQFKDEPSYFSLRVMPSKRVLPRLEEPQVLYLLLEIIPMRQRMAVARRSAPLNLTLVLDRSTSMRGDRLDKVKIAARQILEQLTEQDVISIVSFSDRADVLIPAQHATDQQGLRALVNMLRADGGTEIYQGLRAGVNECRRHLAPRMVNHVILLTDGRTFGDEEKSLQLAETVADEGIGISAMGVGSEWNDEFLDALASRTGGTSAYINSPSAVVRFLNERVRSLGDLFAERLELIIAPDPDVTLESVFRLQPTPQPVEIDTQPIQIGGLEYNRPLSILIQLQMPPSRGTGFRTVARLDVTGDVLVADRQNYKVISDLSVEIAVDPTPEEPPLAILDALSKLTFYRMQQKAAESMNSGDVEGASRRLENLATRLLAAGQDELAQQAMVEARRVANTSTLSEEGRKRLKFGTRMLLALPEPRQE